MSISLSLSSEKIILSNQKAIISTPEGTLIDIGQPSHSLHQRGVQKIAIYTSLDNSATLKLSSRIGTRAINSLPDGRVVTAQRVEN